MIDSGNSQEKKEVGEAVALEQPTLPQLAEKGSEHTETEGQDVAATETVADAPVQQRGKKRVKKAQVAQVTEEELMPHPSMWPFILALSVAVMLGGFAFQPIILGVGVIMVIVCVVGWSLERR